MYKKVSIVPVRFVFADGSVGLIDRPDLFDSELRKSTPMLWEKMYRYKLDIPTNSATHSDPIRPGGDRSEATLGFLF